MDSERLYDKGENNMLSKIFGNIALDTVESSASAGGAGDMVSMIVMMVLMVVVFYFLLIRPQRKKDKAVKAMLAALKKGDRVCTIGGIYGTIIAISDDSVTLSVGSQQNNIVFARWAIRSVEDAVTENDSEPAI